MQLLLDDEIAAEALSLDKNLLEVVAERAYAPGRPVLARLRLGETSAQLRAKSLGSKRLDDGRFAVRLRLVDLRREQREVLQQALASVPSSSPGW